MREDDEERDGQRRTIGRGTLAAVAAVAVILVCVIGYVVGSQAVPQNNLYSADRAAPAPGLSADNAAIPTYAGPPVTDQPVPPAPDLSTAPPAPIPANAMADSVARDDSAEDDDSGSTAADGGGSRVDSDADRQGHADIDQAISDATQAALEQGSSVRWHKDGLSGYVVASAAIADGPARQRRDPLPYPALVPDRRGWRMGAAIA
jgi:hypothetical protein